VPATYEAPHRINRFTADIHFDRPKDALACQEMLPGFIHNCLAPVMDKVLSEVSGKFLPGDDQIIIQKLIVDLGRINPDNFEQEMASKLGACLGEELSREISTRKRLSQPNALPFSFEFLAGKLMEIIKGGSRQKIDPFWIPLLASHGQKTRELLLKQGKNAMVRRQIAWLFPTERLKELILLFEPFNHGFMEYFLDKPELLLTRETLQAATPDTFKKQVAEFILAYLFVEKGSRFNKKVFLASVLKQMSGHYNIPYTTLLLSLVHLFETPKEQSPLKREILAFLLDLARESEGRGVQENRIDSREKEQVFTSLLSDAAGLEKDQLALLERLILTDPDSIAAFLEQNRRYPGLALKLARLLDTPMLGRILKIRNPGRYPVMEKYLTILSRDYYFSLFAGSQKLARQLVWEAALGADSRFREKEFLTHLLDRVVQNSTVAGPKERFFNRLIIRLVLDLQKTREHYTLLKAVLELKGMGSGLDLLREKDVENLDNAGSFFRFFLATPGNRKQIAAVFPKTRIRTLITLIQPVNCEFIITTMAELSLFFQQTGPDQGGTAFTGLLNELVLDFIVQDRANLFNQKNFVANILREMARSRNMDHEKQVGLFRGFMEKGRAKNPVNRQLTRVIQTLENELVFDRKARSAPLEQRVKAFLTEAHPEQAGVGNPLFREKINTFLNQNPLLLHKFIEKHLHRPDFIRFMTAALPPVLLDRILFLLRPRDFIRIKQYTKILEKSIYSALGISGSRKTDIALYQSIFTAVQGKDRYHYLDEACFIPSFLESVAKKLAGYNIQQFYTRLKEALSHSPVQPWEKAEHRRILAVISCPRQATPKPPSPPEPEQPPLPTPGPRDGETAKETLYPGNCGLVIAAPYLPQLFNSLGLMEKSKFKDRASALRAVHLLQYMTDPAEELPVHQLTLNRILCNLKPRTGSEPPFQIKPREKEIIEGLITGMIQNWKIIGNTSIQGFRQSFLCRTGVLTLDQNDCWRLKVDPKAFDMLLDSIPWSFSIIKHPWMDRVLHVTWR
jgi:hypothetical protein